jgi:hypothetical protein
MNRSRAAGADFDAMIGPHLEAGYRTALAILQDPHQAQDAVQESAFKAWRKLHQLRDDGPETLGAYLAEEGGNLDAFAGPGFAIGLKIITGTGDPLNDVVIVRGNGSETKLTGRYMLAW